LHQTTVWFASDFSKTAADGRQTVCSPSRSLGTRRLTSVGRIPACRISSSAIKGSAHLTTIDDPRATLNAVRRFLARVESA
jgi:hypothetical protein